MSSFLWQNSSTGFAQTDAASSPAKPTAAINDWKPLFNGSSLAGWEPIDFAGHGDVAVENGMLVLGLGESLTGIRYTNALPQVNYEVSLEARKVVGNDFFCAVTFPVETNFCTFVVGGWGGAVVGISSIDGNDASFNETTKYRKFETGRWYQIRLRVTPDRIQAWIDDEQMVDLETEGRRIGMRFGEIERCTPFGLAAWQTKAELRQIRLRSLGKADPKTTKPNRSSP